MSDIIHINFDIRPLLAQAKLAAEVTGTEMREVITQEATLFIYNGGKTPGVINITPPFGRGKKGREGLEAGKASIARDLGSIFSGVKLKRRRVITQAFGKKLAQPVTVKTEEMHPDVEAVYQRRNVRRKGRRLTRGQRAAYYVDEQKLKRLQRDREARIGFAAGTWYRAGLEAALPMRGVPSWVKRHTSAPGGAHLTMRPDSFSITLESSLSYNDKLDMAGKARRVLGYREGSLKRRLPHMIRAIAKKSGLQAA